MTRPTIPDTYGDGHFGYGQLLDTDTVDDLVTQHNEHANALDAIEATGSTAGYFNAMFYGAVGDGVVDDTSFIQAALDACHAFGGGTVFLPQPPLYYRITNLTLYANMRLLGSGMRTCTLLRLPGSTGPALRELSAAEGNPGCATGIWLQDFSIDGNNGDGDGIDLGNQGGSQLASQGGIQSVYVSRFPSGIGFKLCANAVSFYYLWAYGCYVGIKTLGAGASIYHSTWAEGCEYRHIWVTDLANQFFGIQIELHAPDISGTNSVIVNDGYDNLFEGVYIALQDDKTTLIENNQTRAAFRGVFIRPEGHTWTDTIVHTPTALGTGPLTHVHDFLVGAADAASYYVDGTSGRWNRVGGQTTAIGTSLQLHNVRYADQITADQNNYAPYGWDTCGSLWVFSDAPRDITGLAAPSADEPEEGAGCLRLFRNRGNFNITLKHLSGSSADGNKIIGYGGADTAIGTNKSVWMFYDNTVAPGFWVVMTPP